MDILGLIIFILFVLVRVLGNKVPEMKDRIPKDWEENWPPTPREWQFPWEEHDEVEQEAGTPQNTEGTAPRKTYLEQKRELESRNRTKLDRAGREQEYAAIHWEGPPEDDFDEIESTSRPGDRLDMPEHPLLHRQTLLNGIILSEVLQPPKSRRGLK